MDVLDSNGMSWDQTTESFLDTYSETFACNDDAGDHQNIATIPETSDQDELSDDAVTTVNCNETTTTAAAEGRHGDARAAE